MLQKYCFFLRYANKLAKNLCVSVIFCTFATNFGKMTKILFICHGNICRSPMAEFIMKQLVAQAGRSSDFEIASAAVSTEEIGNDIYPPAKRMLSAKGVPFDHRAARQMTRADYAYYDHIVCMDQSNLRWLRYIIGDDSDHKASLMMAWAGKSRDVADPWYTGDFSQAYDDILEGCEAMLRQL